MTVTAPVRPRAAALRRSTAMQLAETEYQRFLDLLRSLDLSGWARPTECPGWDVRAMAAHALGMVEMLASVREGGRQVRLAKRGDGAFLDALTALQVDERALMSPAEIVDRFALRAPKAVRGRRQVPGFVRRRRLPIPQTVDGHEESWTIGFLIDTVLTRDPWMHRVDITRATGAAHVLTCEHDGVIVSDVVAEWGARHGRPYQLELTGPAGGIFTSGQGGPVLSLDAVEFCRVVSGREVGAGLLATQVPF